MCTLSMRWRICKCLHWHFQPLPVWVCNTNIFQADHHSPLLKNTKVTCCPDFHRSRFLSLFGRRSAVGVTGLLAIVDPLFIFHLFCLVFLHTWFSFPSLSVVYLTLCSPQCPCVVLFVVSACAHGYWCASGFVPKLVISLNCSGCYLVLLSCIWLHCHQLRTPLHKCM